VPQIGSISTGKTMAVLTGSGGVTQNDGYISPFTRPCQLSGGSAVRGNFQKSHTAENAKHLSGSAFRVDGVHLADLMVADQNLKSFCSRCEKRWGVLRRDVSDEVSEPVDF